MKTPIQDLIGIITKVDNDSLDKNMILSILKFSYLPKEKQHIIDAVKSGLWEVDTPNDLEEYCQNYYDSNFGDKVEEAGI